MENRRQIPKNRTHRKIYIVVLVKNAHFTKTDGAIVPEERCARCNAESEREASIRSLSRTIRAATTDIIKMDIMQKYSF